MDRLEVIISVATKETTRNRLANPFNWKSNENFKVITFVLMVNPMHSVFINLFYGLFLRRLKIIGEEDGYFSIDPA